MKWRGYLFGAVLLVSVPAQSMAQTSVFERLQQFFTTDFAARNFSKALDEARQLEALVKARLGIGNPGYAIALSDIADVFTAQRNFAAAETLYKQALSIRERRLGANSPMVASTLTDMGNMYTNQARYRDAEQVFARALAISEKTLGPDNIGTAVALGNLGNVELSLGKYRSAETRLRRALSLFTKIRGPGDPETAKTVANLANVYDALGDYPKAARLGEEVVATLEKAYGPNHPILSPALVDLAATYQDEGRFADATTSLNRAIKIDESHYGANDPQLASDLNNLGALYWSLGRLQHAEATFNRALTIAEKAPNENRHHLGIMLNNLAGVYRDEDRLSEAAGLYSRSLAIMRSLFGPDHPDVAHALLDLAIVYREQGQYQDAQTAAARAAAIWETALGRNHPDVAKALIVEAQIDRAQHRYDQAQALYRRAIAIMTKTLGPTHVDLATAYNNLASVYADQGQYDDARQFETKAVDIVQAMFGPAHPLIAQFLNNAALVAARRGDTSDALALSRKATQTVVAHVYDRLDRGSQPFDRNSDFIAQRRAYFRTYVSIIATAENKGLGPRPALDDDAFQAAQWADQSSTAAAVQQMSLRFASGSGALADFVRESQDLRSQWQGNNKLLATALGKPDSDQNRKVIGDLRERLGKIDSRLSQIDIRLTQDFPNFAALTRPKPLTVAATQQLLSDDEALVFYLTGTRESYVWAVTRDGFAWHKIAASSKDLAEQVALFRHGLDLNQITGTGKSQLFDLAEAYRMYRLLLAPVDDLVKPKHHLLIVATGALTALPFDLLVTEKPTKLPQTEQDMAEYRDAAWLVKRQAISILPAVESLRALRLFAQKDRAKKPMIGFGDPVFNGDKDKAPSGKNGRGVGSVPAAVLPYTDYWRGAEVDRAMLSKDLPPLPETAKELKAVARDLGADPSDIYLGKNASEKMVKTLPLAEFRVVYFATHGLVAGDIKGMGEPALVLTIPQHPTALDDGLLTSSEVAQLKLNADWVVLSACNTAAGAHPGAEALSGLARAFFYAGARSLLVTQWEVASDAAVGLTTFAFNVLKQNPALGRAEALRRAMIAYQDNKSDPWNAYPAVWGPFTLVGAGEAAN